MNFFKGHGIYVAIVFDYRVAIKTPNSQPLFSERYGYRKPVFSAFGFRVFFEKMRKAND